MYFFSSFRLSPQSHPGTSLPSRALGHSHPVLYPPPQGFYGPGVLVTAADGRPGSTVPLVPLGGVGGTTFGAWARSSRRSLVSIRIARIGASLLEVSIGIQNFGIPIPTDNRHGNSVGHQQIYRTNFGTTPKDLTSRAIHLHYYFRVVLKTLSCSVYLALKC